MELADLCVFTEPQQGASYDTLLSVARRTEQLGFGAFFRSDHYSPMGSASGQPGPTDAWITLAGLARDTTSVRLGTLVTSATFRHPGILAVTVAQVDQMSGGRVELGLGAGWYESEHDAMGVPFAPVRERFDVLEDQLAIVTGMWATPPGSTFDHEGRARSVKGALGLPKPAQQHVPIIIGGRGTSTTPRLAATYADEFNLAFGSLELFHTQRGHVLAACERQGRERPIAFSAALVVAVGSTDAEFERRAAAIRREPDELRLNGAAGSPAEAAEALRRWRDAGAERLYLQVLDLDDLEHLDLIACEVVPLLA